MSKNLGSCQCSDPGCIVHKGSGNCENQATYIMFRIDMQDETGTPMCDHCAQDAFESGLFSSDENEESEADSVELIASGYEYICPKCGHFNRTIEVSETVTCNECHAVLNVSDYHHSIG